MKHISPSSTRTLILIHCEFSRHRGPNCWRYLRRCDRRLIGEDKYPRVFYPEIYVISGGYKAFFHSFPMLCSPSDYVPMEDPRHTPSFYREWHRMKQDSKKSKEKKATSRNPAVLASAGAPPSGYSPSTSSSASKWTGCEQQQQQSGNNSHTGVFSWSSSSTSVDSSMASSSSVTNHMINTLSRTASPSLSASSAHHTNAGSNQTSGLAANSVLSLRPTSSPHLSPRLTFSHINTHDSSTLHVPIARSVSALPPSTTQTQRQTTTQDTSQSQTSPPSVNHSTTIIQRNSNKRRSSFVETSVPRTTATRLCFTPTPNLTASSPSHNHASTNSNSNIAHLPPGPVRTESLEMDHSYDWLRNMTPTPTSSDHSRTRTPFDPHHALTSPEPYLRGPSPSMLISSSSNHNNPYHANSHNSMTYIPSPRFNIPSPSLPSNNHNSMDSTGTNHGNHMLPQITAIPEIAAVRAVPNDHRVSSGSNPLIAAAAAASAVAAVSVLSSTETLLTMPPPATFTRQPLSPSTRPIPSQVMIRKRLSLQDDDEEEEDEVLGESTAMINQSSLHDTMALKIVTSANEGGRSSNSNFAHFNVLHSCTAVDPNPNVLPPTSTSLSQNSSSSSSSSTSTTLPLDTHSFSSASDDVPTWTHEPPKRASCKKSIHF